MTPKSLGYVMASGSTPVRVTVNEDDPTLGIPVQAILFTALPGNSNVVYVGLGNMDPSTGVGVLGFIAAPADPVFGPFPSVTIAVPNIPTGMTASSFYITEDGSGNGALVSLTAG